MIENGQVFGREPPENYSYYMFVPIGPVVKTGEFGSQREKVEAIRKAKKEALPAEQFLNALQDELAAAKAKLAKLRAGRPGG